MRVVPATGFSFLLGWYDTLVAVFAAEQALKSHLIDLARVAQDERILDVGSGSGTLALSIKTAHPQAHVAGIDADLRILEQAKRKDRAGTVDWLLGNACSLDFPNEQFQHVFCTLLLHHLEPADKVRCVDEIYRVLAPGGCLYLADFCKPASLLDRLKFVPARLLDGWQRTRCNVQGRIPSLICNAGFVRWQESLTIGSWLGTIRCYHAEKPTRNLRPAASPPAS